MLWQALFLLLGTSWLWAPYLNDILSYRVSLISQYETPSQPYSWLFRLADVLAGILLLIIAIYIHKLNKIMGLLLFSIGVCLLLDPILTTSCKMIDRRCVEYTSLNYIAHVIETIVLSMIIFLTSFYDTLKRKRIVSVSFLAFQILYGLLFLAQFSEKQSYNTLTQVIYQTTVILWLAWLCRDLIVVNPVLNNSKKTIMIRKITASWILINGILSIIIGFTHLELFGRFRGLYFAGDTSWLAQHGVITGIVMLYLSRHLLRGEQRARQIFLFIVGLETLKYSAITPNPWLLIIYSISFIGLFVLKDEFNRGSIPLTLKLKIKDVFFMVGALSVASLVALLILVHSFRGAQIVNLAINNIVKYDLDDYFPLRGHLRSILLAHTITAFIVFSTIIVLWILFKPNKSYETSNHDYRRVEKALKHYSNSTEDYFKLWPEDKDFFWHNEGFIAYKITGSVAFALADPISKDRTELLQSFTSWCEKHRWTTCILPVYPSSLSIYEIADFQTLQIGSSALINIATFLETTAHDKWWRWQKNRAKSQNYIFKYAQPPHSKNLIKACQKVSDEWLEIGGHKERGFALGYFDELYLQKCDIHLLTNEKGEIIAFCNQLPRFTDSQTISIDMLRHVPSADNAMSYLLYKIIEHLQPQAKYFDLGFVPFANADNAMVRIARILSGGRFSAKGLMQFKNKFKPDWQPVNLVYKGDFGDVTKIALQLEKLMDKKSELP